MIDIRGLILDCLAIEYHLRCEEFDRLVSDARSPRGAAVPTTGAAFGAMNRNADAVLREQWFKAQIIGFTPSELQRAISNAARWY